MIPLFKVFISDKASESVARVLASGYVGEGDVVKEFEKALVPVVGNDVIAVNSGTSAITIALRMAGVDVCSQVAATPMTCLATNEPILALGADPVWIDVNPRTGNMCPDSLQRALEKHRGAIQAIICVHWGGYPCDLEEINEIGRIHNVPVIEDAAHALMSVYQGDFIGSHSDFVCFSFQAIKTITSVDGGALTCKSHDQVERAKLMRWFGLDRTSGSEMRCKQNPIEFGYKFQMNNLNASIGLANLKFINTLIGQRKLIAQIYNKELQGLRNVQLLEYQNDRESAYWLYTVKVKNTDKFSKHLADNGIASSQVHGRNDKKSIFSLSADDNLPGVDEFSVEEVCIPIGYWLSLEDVNYIIEVIRRY